MPEQRRSRSYNRELVRDHSEVSVILAEDLRDQATEKFEQVSALRSDGHGLHFLVKVSDGDIHQWRRVIITTP